MRPCWKFNSEININDQSDLVGAWTKRTLKLKANGVIYTVR